MGLWKIKARVVTDVPETLPTFQALATRGATFCATESWMKKVGGATARAIWDGQCTKAPLKSLFWAEHRDGLTPMGVGVGFPWARPQGLRPRSRSRCLSVCSLVVVLVVLVMVNTLERHRSFVPGAWLLDSNWTKLKIPVPTRRARAWLVSQVLWFSSFDRHFCTGFSVRLINTQCSFVIAYTVAKPNIGKWIKRKGFWVFLLPLPFFCVFARSIAFYT